MSATDDDMHLVRKLHAHLKREGVLLAQLAGLDVALRWRLAALAAMMANAALMALILWRVW